MKYCRYQTARLRSIMTARIPCHWFHSLSGHERYFCPFLVREQMPKSYTSSPQYEKETPYDAASCVLSFFSFTCTVCVRIQISIFYIE